MEFNHPLTDRHVHPNFSIDAEGTLREYCNRAIEIGLSEIIFTTHIDSNPIEEEFNRMVINGQQIPHCADTLKKYREAVYELVEGNDPVKISVKCGVEVGYYDGIKHSFLQMIADQDFDYVLCGVHYVGDHILTLGRSMTELIQIYDPETIIEKYYQSVLRASEIEMFDCLAHLDIYRRHGMKMFPEQAARIDYPIIDEVLDKLAQVGLPIEVNTSGIRHEIGDWYPSKPLIDKARRAGVIIGGLGSDAHSPEQLAIDFEMAHIYVHESFPSLFED